VFFFSRRKPAWTDRILYMHGATCQVHQLSYSSHPQIIMSDHRPVSADFTVDVSSEETHLERRIGLWHTSQADVYDTEELQDSVQTLFNQVYDLQRQRVRDRGELKINDTYLDFEKISYVHYLDLTKTGVNWKCHRYDKPVERKFTVENTSTVCKLCSICFF
jgi:inositol polyphosphate 5-phosphatase INPP5B/F